MFTHLEYLNEDAINYEWSDVRAWSEEICTLVAEGKVAWSDEYRIDILRLKLSQEGRRKTAPTQTSTGRSDKTDVTSNDIIYHLNPELKAAKPGPPCKAYNAGTCSYSSDHVTNGYRQLHVCGHCLSAKCLFWPHAEKGCRTKEFKRQRPEQLGFGK